MLAEQSTLVKYSTPMLVSGTRLVALKTSQ